MHRLENCRNEYRLARARVYSRLRALASYIDYIFPSEDNIISSQGLSTRALLDASIGGIDRLADEMNDCVVRSTRPVKMSPACKYV